MALLADSEVFRAFATYAVIVLVKMMALGPVTAYYRITRKVFANLEDAAGNSRGGDPKKYIRTDQDVERVRRCHLNDIENIIPFIGVGLLYALSNPDLSSALLHFRIFTVSRLLHTVSYLTPLPQPSRALCFLVGYLVTLSMAFFTVRSLLYI
ncbi:microsomal glutathione S-transferase 1 [Hyla sarda]|uniref:microsomal glutathione S-transferase 1 n=1 Tax=Hyla sarda TaxID=327740 RepID=UPI0024C41283|nr:microsomal glutathione S-transferase 1 [Hyla sarda]